jgi:prolyl 4-hydroxylase
MILDSSISHEDAETADTSMSMHIDDDNLMAVNIADETQNYDCTHSEWQQQPTLHPVSLLSLQVVSPHAHIQPNHIGNTFSSYQQQPLMAYGNHNSTHNLIPTNSASSANIFHSLNGTPGYPPAVIPHHQTQQPQPQPQPQLRSQIGFTPPNITTSQIPTPGLCPTATTHVYTVQDCPILRLLHAQPPIFCVDDFLTEYECNFLIQHASDSFGPAPVVGKGFGEVSPSRTSSTCYIAREDVPSIMRKIAVLTGKPVETCELPQVGRYFPTQQYLQHYDAFDLSTEDGRRFATNGGQRVITVLIYLNTVHRGGATRFPALNFEVRPVRGMALVFFPATVDGLLDKTALHAALPAIDTKYVSQIWIRQSVYSGQPSKRLPQPLGIPFGLENMPFISQQLISGGTAPVQQHQTMLSFGFAAVNTDQNQIDPLHQQQLKHSNLPKMQF